MGRENLSEFEQLVLLACIRLDGQAYTVAIVDELLERSGRQTSHASVYLALRRLESKGLLHSALGETTPERGGRPKRYFVPAPHALSVLREARDALLSMWDGLEGTP